MPAQTGKRHGPLTAKVTPVPDTCLLQLRVFDGTRRPFSAPTSVLYRVIDANQREIVEEERKTAVLNCEFPYHDNFMDNYTVIVFSDGFKQTGFTPVKLSNTTPTVLDLMLIPKGGHFNFAQATWDWIKTNLPFMTSGASDAEGQRRYENLMEDKPNSLAALLNITTAMKAIQLPQGTPLDYLRQLKWDDTLAQDRFFAYCDPRLIDQVRIAATQGEFAPETSPAFFHPGATASWKQIQFGEANVQLTFHEGDRQAIEGVNCILVEPDIDYYKDLAAHTLLEVIPNALTGGLTNPEMVYVLRWIAGRHAGVPEFSPPYTIES
ncbi:MAG TPA: hypothetical protein VEI54_00275 [Candidatus Limnocylindrales bacterium]|nr:hypothetical protein [Candidatus Limnocylindrales bacterium]